MSGSERLDPQQHAWMTAPATRAVMEALSPGDSDRARFVGGCVRNAIQGRPVDDVDIATRLTPPQAQAALEQAGVKVIPTGIEHGTVTAVAEGQPFEVTTLRRDVETFGRRAVVAFSTDWAEDAGRRDFRLNAIYARRDGRLFDPFDGVADARAGRVVFIGEAEDRIAEDYLRILRFYRFNAWYADGLDPAGQAACAKLAHTLSELAAERVWKELKKLLLAPDPGPAARAMQEGHVWAVLWSGSLDFNLFLSIINSDRGRARAPDPLLRIAALAGRDADVVRSLCERMKMSNAERARLEAMTGPLPAGVDRLTVGLDPRARRRALYHLGAEAFCDRMRLEEAAHGGDAGEDLAEAAHWVRPVRPVGGRDLVQAGVPKGPALGEKLAALEAAWVDSDFALDRAALLARLGEGEA